MPVTVKKKIDWVVPDLLTRVDDEPFDLLAVDPLTGGRLYFQIKFTAGPGHVPGTASNEIDLVATKVEWQEQGAYWCGIVSDGVEPESAASTARRLVPAPLQEPRNLAGLSSAARERIPEDVSERLKYLASLPEGWDDGASGISERATGRARHIIQKAVSILGPTAGDPFIAPSPDGGLSLEWKVRGGNVLIIEVPPEPDEDSFLFIQRESPGQEQVIRGLVGQTHSIEDVLQLKSRT